MAHKPGEKQNSTIREFSGINTRSSRMTIGDNEFDWLENVMPIGHGHMQTVPGSSAALATLAATCYYMKSANINAVDYMFMFCTNGSAYQVNLTSYAVTTIAAAGKFSGTTSRIEQWKDERILIVDSNGYWDWDGSTLTTYNATVQSLTVTSYGAGYTSRPAVAFGGPGTSASATAIIGVALATISAAGTGYAVGDLLTISGGTAGTAAIIKVLTTTGAGIIATISIVTPGDYTAVPANPAAVTGGYGTAATFTLNFGLVNFTNLVGGSGYVTAPSVTMSGGGATTQGTASAAISATPSSGTAIAVYQSRVWVVTGNGRTIAFSAPDNYKDFSSSGSGGSFIMTDPTMISTVQQLVTANNYLYIVGTNSVNVLSDVRVASGVTAFTNTNISTNIGTTFPVAIETYYRALWMVNPSGFYALYGATPQKTSEVLDGLFPLLDLTKPVTSGLVVMYGELCAVWLMTYNDPVAGARPILLVFHGDKWFIASQGNTLTLIESAGSNSLYTIFGTDGTHLYKLFSDTTVNVSQTIKTKLWDYENSLTDKQVMKIGLEVTSASLASISVSIDTEYSSYASTLGSSLVGIWTNNSLQVGTWTNNALQTGNWYVTGYQYITTDASTTGKYVGMTLTSTTPQVDYNAMHMQYIMRASW